MTATIQKPNTPAVDPDSYQLVRKQFGECSVKAQFLPDFYADFTGQSAEIRNFFAKTDMTKQREALKNGLSFLVMYAGGQTLAVDKLDRLGKSHSRTGYNIRPDLYPLWINALVRTVKKHVAVFGPREEAAWRKVLQAGVDRIVAGY